MTCSIRQRIKATLTLKDPQNMLPYLVSEATHLVCTCWWSIPRSPEDTLPRCSPRPQPQGHREEKQWKQMVRSKMSWEAAKHPGTKGNPSSKGIPRGACQTDRAVSTSQKFLDPSKLAESVECFSSPNRGTKVRRLLLDGSEITPCGKREELKPPENQYLLFTESLA